MSDEIPNWRHVPCIDDATGKTDWIDIRPRRVGRECQDCEAFVLFGQVDPGFGKRDGLQGHCRHNSPAGHSPGYHPEVRAIHWCLQFRKRGGAELTLDAFETLMAKPQP